MAWTTRRWRRCGGLGWVLAGVAAGVGGLSFCWSPGVAVGRVGVRATGGVVLVVTADVPMEWRGGDWVFRAGGSEGRVRADGGDQWRPRTNRVGMMIGSMPPTAVWPRLTTVPLWPVAGLLGGVGAVAWQRGAAAARRGGCAACGYDTRGLSGVCPECGAG